MEVSIKQRHLLSVHPKGKKSVLRTPCSSASFCVQPSAKQKVLIPADRRSLPQNSVRDELSLNTLRFSSLHLYGRESESSQLREAYDHVVRRQKSPLWKGGESPDNEASSSFSPPDLILISGSSGTGKTALAKRLIDPVKQTGGFFVSGKFDAQRQGTPYIAFITAFTKLCDEILSLKMPTKESKTVSFTSIQSVIREAVGSEGNVLTEVIPNLSRVVGESHIMQSDLGVQGTRNQFIILIRRFLRAVSNQVNLVLFLDDLHWADTASLDLLQTLIADRENSGLLIVGSYRDDEVSSSHVLSKWLDEVKKPDGDGGTVSISRIPLMNLDVGTVNNLIADVLSSSLSATEGLANIVHKKTHGNIFFVIHFLKSLHDENILSYCLGQLCWKWNEDEVQSSTSVTDNVADLMVAKLRNNLMPNVRGILQIGACLGSIFEASMLGLIMKELKRDLGGGRMCSTLFPEVSKEANQSLSLKEAGDRVELSLDMCVKEGLLEKDDASRYRFSHDQIQHAALSLIPEDSFDFLQFQIGEVLLNNLSESNLERVLFIAVGLLNHGTEFISGNSEKCMKIAWMNLQAGKKAMKSSAFGPAAAYLKKGVNLLGSNPWENHYDITLDLYNSATEAECCNGNLEEMQIYLDHILPKAAVPIHDKIRSYSTQIYSMCHFQGKAPEAVDVALHVLTQLGVHFPKTASKHLTIGNFVKTAHLLKGHPIDAMSNLPEMEDRNKLNAMQIMDKLCELAYFARPSLVPLVALKMVRWSVHHGICKYSVPAFVMYGLILCGLGKIQEGNRFGKMAISLMGGLQAKDMGSKVHFLYNAFLSHWILPAHLVHKQFLHAYNIGMQTGDIGFALLSARVHCSHALNIGRPLSLIDADAQTYSRQMKEYRHQKALDYLGPMWQFVLNMMGRSENPVVLTGEAMEQEELLRRCTETEKNMGLRSVILSYQLWLAYYFGEYEMAQKIMKVAKDVDRTIGSSPQVWRHALFEGLTAFALLRITKKRMWKCHAAKITKKVKKWIGKGNVNMKHVLLLFEAEKAAFDRDTEKAQRLYREAIATTSRYGFLHDKALANERAGEFYNVIGDMHWASYHLDLAKQLYTEWGSEAKADHLQKKHAQLFGQMDTYL